MDATTTNNENTDSKGETMLTATQRATLEALTPAARRFVNDKVTFPTYNGWAASPDARNEVVAAGLVDRELHATDPKLDAYWWTRKGQQIAAKLAGQTVDDALGQ
jgi:hypothetical protein